MPIARVSEQPFPRRKSPPNPANETKQARNRGCPTGTAPSSIFLSIATPGITDQSTASLRPMALPLEPRIPGRDRGFQAAFSVVSLEVEQNHSRNAATDFVARSDPPEKVRRLGRLSGRSSKFQLSPTQIGDSNPLGDQYSGCDVVTLPTLIRMPHASRRMGRILRDLSLVERDAK